MKTVLVLAEHPDFAEAVRVGLDPDHFRVVHRSGLEEAEPLLTHGMADACVIDVEVGNVQGIWFLEKLRRRAPKLPVILFTGTKGWEWEEEAYLQGVVPVLATPVRPRLLTSILERLSPAPAAAGALTAPRSMAPPPLVPTLAPETRAAEAPAAASAQTLTVLRDFSGILTHSLNAEAMLRQFLLLLREILSVNRAAVFLRQPFASFGDSPALSESRRLRSVSAIGLSPGLLQHFELSFEGGIRLSLSPARSAAGARRRRSRRG